MARLTLKLCMAAACLMLVCTAVASATDSDELTDKQLEAQMEEYLGRGPGAERTRASNVDWARGVCLVRAGFLPWRARLHTRPG